MFFQIDYIVQLSLPLSHAKSAQTHHTPDNRYPQRNAALTLSCFMAGVEI